MSIASESAGQLKNVYNVYCIHISRVTEMDLHMHIEDRYICTFNTYGPTVTCLMK